MSKFTDHLKATKQTQRAFAAKVGISENFLSEIISGKRIPRLRDAKAISDATGGVIATSHWVDPDGPRAKNAQQDESIDEQG